MNWLRSTLPILIKCERKRKTTFKVSFMQLLQKFDISIAQFRVYALDFKLFYIFGIQSRWRFSRCGGVDVWHFYPRNKLKPWKFSINRWRPHHPFNECFVCYYHENWIMYFIQAVSCKCSDFIVLSFTRSILVVLKIWFILNFKSTIGNIYLVDFQQQHWFKMLNFWHCTKSVYVRFV